MVYPPVQTVTHPSSNRAQCRLTTLIEANALTTELHHHVLVFELFRTALNSRSRQPLRHRAPYRDIIIFSINSTSLCTYVYYTSLSVTM